MKIRCKKSKRYLCEIEIEDYLEKLEKLGISQEIPLEIKVLCRSCKEQEIYHIYKTHYKFIGKVARKI